MRLKQRVFNLMLWGLAILVTIVVIVGFLCWMGVIPASILTQPIRRMSNLLVAFVLFVPKTFPKIKTILNDLLIKTARALLLNPLFYILVVLWSLLRFKLPPKPFRAYDRFRQKYVNPRIAKIRRWCGNSERWWIKLWNKLFESEQPPSSVGIIQDE